MNILLYIFAVLIVLLSIIIWRTAVFKPAGLTSATAGAADINEERAAQSLSGALKIKTISNEDYSKTDFGQFDLFLNYLEERFPKVYDKLEHEAVNTHSLLYRWKGSESGRKPVLLMAHYDVVPVENGSEVLWNHPPFSGSIADGMIWGRGSLDIKCQVIGILEAVEVLLEENFTPSRDIYIAFGHDEEVDGQEGARRIAELLEGRGLDFEFVLDEGSRISEDMMPGVKRPLALIGLCEKGYADVRLSSLSSGGHSSTPGDSTALSIVCEGVARLQKHQFRRRIISPVKWFLKAVSQELPLIDRMIAANLWLFGWLFKKRFSKTPSGNALLRTSTASTMSGGSPQANVLPQKAWAVINFRLLNGETQEDLERHMKKVLRGLDIKTELLISNDPSAVSSYESNAFKIIAGTVSQVFPEALPAPYIMTGASDSIKYEKVSPNIFRFSPYHMKSCDNGKIHGNNECISIRSMAGVVKFYRQLMRNV